MRLDKAEYRDGVLHLTTRDPEAIRFAYRKVMDNEGWDTERFIREFGQNYL